MYQHTLMRYYFLSSLSVSALNNIRLRLYSFTFLKRSHDSRVSVAFTSFHSRQRPRFSFRRCIRGWLSDPLSPQRSGTKVKGAVVYS
jgi:hypothetical protein